MLDILTDRHWYAGIQDQFLEVCDELMKYMRFSPYFMFFIDISTHLQGEKLKYSGRVVLGSE